MNTDLEVFKSEGSAGLPAARGHARRDLDRYTVLSMEHEQRVPLVDGPSVRCR
jgi:hypothetical protein